MRNITSYTGSYANPGNQVPYVSINRTADLTVTITCRNTKGLQMMVEVPAAEWERMLRESIKEFMENDRGR